MTILSKPAWLFEPGDDDMFLQLGLEIGGFTYRKSQKSNNRNFRSVYGTRPDAVCQMWEDIKTDEGDDFPERAHPKHLFWTLMFMKMYGTNIQLAGRLKKDPSHIQPWVMYFGRRLQALKEKVIKFSNCDPEDDCVFILSSDGTHCLIQEFKSFAESSKHCSFKYKHSCYAYEVAISIWRSKIVWITGPYAAGKKDHELFRKKGKLFDAIPEGKLTINDRGYRIKALRKCCSTPNRHDHPDLAQFKSRVRSRNEHIFKRIKDFACMGGIWRHPREHHKIFFEACCVVTQYNMDFGDVLFDVLPAQDDTE